MLTLSDDIAMCFDPSNDHGLDFPDGICQTLELTILPTSLPSERLQICETRGGDSKH